MRKKMSLQTFFVKTILSCCAICMCVKFTVGEIADAETESEEDAIPDQSRFNFDDFEDDDHGDFMYRREVGELTYTMNKLHYANWPDAFETCRKKGASLMHFENKADLPNIRTVLKDPELRDVAEFWSAGVVDKSSGKPGFVNIDLNYELNFFKFIRGDSRCVSFATKRGADNSTLVDLNYAFCMRKKAFRCQEPKKIQVNETIVERQYYEKEINGWVYSINMTKYATWMEAFESCKSRGANLISAAKYDRDSAWQLSKDPQLRGAIRFWSAGVINPKGINVWLSKSTNLIEDSSLLHAMLDGKLNCIYHRMNVNPSSQLPPSSTVTLYSYNDNEAAAKDFPMNYCLCSVKMLYMCEEPTYQILRTDSEENSTDSPKLQSTKEEESE